MAVRMAHTVMTIWKDSLYTDPAKPAKWTYDQGVILKGIEGLWLQTGDPAYFRYMQQSMDFFVDEKGHIRTYKASDENLDNLLCGRVLLRLYQVTGKNKYLLAAQQLYAQLQKQPRTPQGGFWHKKIYPGQMWLDGLYMAEPFYAMYTDMFHLSDNWKDIAHQFILAEQHTRDPQTGLLYHAWDASKEQAWANKQTGRSPHSWARAMGWYGMALADVLEQFPEAEPGRDSLIAILQRYAATVARYQQPSGLWYDVLDMPGEKRNYYESSAACMFVCVLAKSVRLGWLPAKYLSVAQKGYHAILTKFVRNNAEGLTSLEGTVSVSGLGGKPYRDGSFDYYMREKVVTNDPKGMGAFLQMANEMALSVTSRLARNRTVMLDDYFNSERKKDMTGTLIPFHYKWEEWDNNGSSLLGHIFRSYGMQTRTLSEEPDAAKLKAASIYLIVDADNETDNPHPNYMTNDAAAAIEKWVKAGGGLVIMHNDKGNADFSHINLLTDRFGIHLNEDSYNRVTGLDFTGGAISVPAGNVILPHVKKIYQKEICSITVQTPAKAMLEKNGLVIFAVAKVGKGTVFVTGDPWLYNEYTDGRKLPLEYENFKAAKDWVNWLIHNIPKTQTGKQ